MHPCRCAYSESIASDLLQDDDVAQLRLRIDGFCSHVGLRKERYLITGEATGPRFDATSLSIKHPASNVSKIGLGQEIGRAVALDQHPISRSNRKAEPRVPNWPYWLDLVRAVTVAVTPVLRKRTVRPAPVGKARAVVTGSRICCGLLSYYVSFPL